MREITKADAIIAINPDSKFSYFHPPQDEINWISEDISQPTEEEIQAKLTELRDAEPMRLLREERNQKLQETDWTQYRDVTLSNDSDWQTYRQSLRDLPQNFSPIIDIITEDGYPIVKEQTDWPEKPS